MKRLDLLVLARDVQTVTEGLAELGVMHITPARRPETEGLLEPPDTGPHLDRCRHIRRQLEELMQHLELRPDPRTEVDVRTRFQFEEVSAQLGALRDRLQQVERSATAAGGRIPELEAMLAELEPFRPLPLPLEDLEKFSFLHFATGSLPEAEAPAVAGEVADRSLMLPLQRASGRETVLAVASKKDRWALETLLNRHGFRSERLFDRYPGLAAETVERLQKQLTDARTTVAQAEQARATLRQEVEHELGLLWRRAVVEERMLEAQERFGKTTSTYAISGWVPQPEVSQASRRVREFTGGRVLIEEQDAEQLLAQGQEVPTLMRQHWLLRPFQAVVSGYGFPRYNEVEPTVFVALSFLAMFGLMFGDVGQGAVLLVGGLLVRRWVGSRGVKDFAFVLAACGLSSILFGFLYGSVFGYEGLVPSLWLRPMEQIGTLLTTVLLLGVGMMSAGLLINIINRVSQRQYFEGLLSRYGVVGFIFYWGAIGLALRYFEEGAQAVTAGRVLLFVGLPVLLLVLREPLHMLFTRRPATAGTVLGAALEGATDVLETMIAFLANTVSFIRVGAFALSHAGLCLATFAVADLVRQSAGGTFGAWAVILCGNALILILEGLVVTIQAVRLEYYEFFSKFFSGEGWAFQPLTLGSEE
jgi:V/A-type H+-transporting ATPase subunit I